MSCFLYVSIFIKTPFDQAKQSLNLSELNLSEWLTRKTIYLSLPFVFLSFDLNTISRYMEYNYSSIKIQRNHIKKTF